MFPEALKFFPSFLQEIISDFFSFAKSHLPKFTSLSHLLQINRALLQAQFNFLAQCKIPFLGKDGRPFIPLEQFALLSAINSVGQTLTAKTAPGQTILFIDAPALERYTQKAIERLLSDPRYKIVLLSHEHSVESENLKTLFSLFEPSSIPMIFTADFIPYADVIHLILTDYQITLQGVLVLSGNENSPQENKIAQTVFNVIPVKFDSNINSIPQLPSLNRCNFFSSTLTPPPPEIVLKLGPSGLEKERLLLKFYYALIPTMQEILSKRYEGQLRYQEIVTREIQAHCADPEHPNLAQAIRKIAFQQLFMEKLSYEGAEQKLHTMANYSLLRQLHKLARHLVTLAQENKLRLCFVDFDGTLVPQGERAFNGGYDNWARLLQHLKENNIHPVCITQRLPVLGEGGIFDRIFALGFVARIMGGGACWKAEAITLLVGFIKKLAPTLEEVSVMLTDDLPTEISAAGGLKINAHQMERKLPEDPQAFTQSAFVQYVATHFQIDFPSAEAAAAPRPCP